MTEGGAGRERRPTPEAFDRVGGRFDVRVLEPSPPAVNDAAVVRRRPGRHPSRARPGLPLLSPVSSADLTWDDLARDEPDLADWCAARWLGAYRRLGPLPDRAVRWWRPATALHAVGRARAGARAAPAATGKIGLRYTVGGFGTPFFGRERAGARGGCRPRRGARRSRRPHADHDDRRRRTVRRHRARRPGRPLPAGDDGRARRRARRRSRTRRGSSATGTASRVRCSKRLRVVAGATDTRTQLWPEHFDLSIDVGDEAAGTRGTFGSSPGDAAHPEPYLYATHWSADVQPDPFWNDTAFRGRQPAVRRAASTPTASARPRSTSSAPRAGGARCSPMAEPAPVRRRRSHLSLALLAVPQVILFGGMLVMLVVHPNAVKSGVMSTRAVVVNAVLLIGWLLLSFVILPRLLRNVPARAAVLSVLAIAAVVVLVVPTLVDKKVVEAFPMPEAVAEAAPGHRCPSAPRRPRTDRLPSR